MNIRLMEIANGANSNKFLGHPQSLTLDAGHSGGCCFNRGIQHFSQNKVNLLVATAHPDGADPPGTDNARCHAADASSEQATKAEQQKAEGG